MNRFCYTCLLKVVAPIMLALLARKAKRAGGVWEIRAPERFGRYEGVAPALQGSAVAAADDEVAVALDFKRAVWVLSLIHISEPTRLL